MIRLISALAMILMLAMPATAAVKIKFEPGPLEKLTVPSEWPFSQNSNFLERHKSFSIDDNSLSRGTMADCVFWLTNWEKNSEEDRKSVV